MDGTGRGIAGWSDGSQINVAFFNGTTWGPVSLFGANAVDPSVAISPTGTALTTWTNSVTGQIFANFFNGTIWGPDTLISIGVNNQGSDVGMSATGLGVAVWNNGNDVFAAQFNGATWSAPVVISTGLSNTNAHIDVQADGRAAAAWVDGAGNVQAALFNGITWTAPTVISTTVGANQGLEIAMDGSGNVVVVWAFSGLTNEILSAFHRTGDLNVWDPPLIVDSHPVFVYQPDAAFSQSGRAFAVWNDDGDGPFDTFASFINFIIPPPLDFTGRSCSDRFAWQRDCVHILTWTPVVNPVVVTYRLRRNGTVIANIPATGPFTFVDHNRCNRTDVYSLSSVDALGNESLPVFVTLR
jgi:hypothetical protein